jgi:beta-phosphoglucomutase
LIEREGATVSGFAGAIFDVDGVLVDSPHERAWRDGLQELMEGPWRDIAPQTTYAPEKFTPRAALDYFEVPDVDARVDEYADRKQTMVIELIEAGEFHAFPDALRFIMAVKDMGIKVAAASSSKNARLFLRQIRLDTFAEENGLSYDFLKPGLSLLDFFDADLSGRDFAQGKPHPEIFLTSASELGEPPEACFVIEDAVSGVQAAKAGNMAGLGLARADDEDALAAAHADLVVTSLDDVDLDGLREGILRRTSA